MKDAINIVVLACGVLSIIALVKVLVSSQKDSEVVKPSRLTYVMYVQIAGLRTEGQLPRKFEANNLQYLQETLNNITFRAIEHAEVRTLDVVTHRMDATGVLRPV